MGLAGRPENVEAFAVFKAEGADIYVARDIWEQLAGDGCSLNALLPGYGMACFHFEC